MFSAFANVKSFKFVPLSQNTLFAGAFRIQNGEINGLLLSFPLRHRGLNSHVFMCLSLPSCVRDTFVNISKLLVLAWLITNKDDCIWSASNTFVMTTRSEVYPRIVL